ncbi:hypothetical protein WS68_16120 [Burkholderia sp. TSV86]|nr:hypothetical protein WS68_16120 [Burkholderia sp. TSV86]
MTRRHPASGRVEKSRESRLRPLQCDGRYKPSCRRSSTVPGAIVRCTALHTDRITCDPHPVRAAVNAMRFARRIAAVQAAAMRRTANQRAPSRWRAS